MSGEHQRNEKPVQVRVVLFSIDPERFNKKARGTHWTVVEDLKGAILFRSWTSHNAASVIRGAVNHCIFKGHILTEYATATGEPLDLNGVDL